MKFYLHICNQYQPSLSKSILIWLGVISPKKAANLTILFSPLSASAFGVHCQQNVWHWKNWIPTTNYLRMTVASISEKPVSSGLWKAVWQAVKPPDDQVRVQQYFCHKAKFSTPKWSVRFPCKSRSTTPVIKFLCKSFTAQVALVTMQKHSNFKEGFPFMIQKFWQSKINYSSLPGKL